MTSRSVLGRPRRTKMYDCNYNMGESYYKPVVDSLDRKRAPGGVSSSIRTPSPERNAISHMRATLLANDDELSASRARRAAELDLDSEPRLSRRQQRNLDEYDSIFEGRNKGMGGGESAARSLRSMEDDVDQQISDSMKRIKMRVAESSLEDDFVSNVAMKGSKRRELVDFQDKLLDTVGLRSSDKSRLSALDDESSSSLYKRRTMKMSEEEDSAPRQLSKWTALKMDADDDFGAAEAAAAARARKTRARLADLDAEMEELTNRSAARDKRVQQLRDLIKESESTTADSGSSSSSLKSSMVQKSSSVRSEKKTVTF